MYKFDRKVEYSNGDIYFFKNNKLHNENGPAIKCKDGYEYYFLNGKKLSKKEYKKKLKVNI